jgi:hypothetical protein
VLSATRVNQRPSLTAKPLFAGAPRRTLAVLGILSAGLTAGGTGKAAVTAHDHDAPAPVVTTCDSWSSVINGRPDITSVPAIQSVKLTSLSGGLLVSVRFSKPFPLAPEGVYFAWDVHLFRRRADAAPPELSTLLQVEDRGKGWQPTGWTVLASSYNNGFPIDEDIASENAHDELVAYFPVRFVSTQAPFYWYVSQEAYRAYLPDGGDPNWAVNGSLTDYCPPGVQADPYTPPVPAKLLEW